MRKIQVPIKKLIAVVIVFAMSVLAGCNVNMPIIICHSTGDVDAPYQEITINTIDELKTHQADLNDIYPVPEGGCPSALVENNNGNITICHATTDETNPYSTITVSVAGLNGHGTHAGDIIPAPEGGCPTSPLVIVEKMITICHASGIEATPYEEITVKLNGLDGHFAHVDDIIPAPLAGCPTIPLSILNGKISICHVTSSEKNPYNEISVNINGLNGHVNHLGDLIPAPAIGCPSTLLVAAEGKITICHATGSDKNPYSEIKISLNGLEGHGNHEGDIIPMNGSCPVTKQ
ncbi:MAG TPA: hypothetical protein DIW44_13075 [Anaerolineaceae bacterium]|nr:hypothetical protein [Anaerolineaceae bacterium]